MEGAHPHKYLITAKGYEFFTRQHVRVLQLFLNKKTRREIAYELCLSPLTVKNHFTALRKKLNCKNDVGIYEACVMEGYAVLDRFE